MIVVPVALAVVVRTVPLAGEVARAVEATVGSRMGLFVRAGLMARWLFAHALPLVAPGIVGFILARRLGR